jgi:hypothetical protein
MNNGEREINNLLTSCEKELTALKTAHRHPLGALDFYNKRETLNINLSESYGVYEALFWVDVTIETPDVTPPIVQIGWDVPSGFNYVDLFEYNINANYSVWSYKLFLQSPSKTTAVLPVSAISSVKINSISYRSA